MNINGVKFSRLSYHCEAVVAANVLRMAAAVVVLRISSHGGLSFSAG
jgi:hypothetical protein